MKSECDKESWALKSVCDALANVYYTAVKNLGGADATPGKRAAVDDDEDDDKIDWAAEYESRLAAYNAVVAAAGL